MTGRSFTPQSRSARRDVATHLFTVGQAVRLKRWCGSSHRFEEIYHITGTLPPRDNSPQYRIRNDEEGHDRVATQDSLMRADVAQSGDSGTTLMERTFGNGQGTETQQSRDQKAETGESTAET